MKKIIALHLAICMTFFLLTGCADGTSSDAFNAETSAAVKEDLTKYVQQQMPPCVALEDAITDAYVSVTGKNYKNDQTSLKIIKTEIIPNSEKLVAKIKAIQPSTDVLNRVHQMYITSVTDQNEAFVLMAQAVDQKKPAVMKTANQKLEKAVSLSNQYISQVKALEKSNNVTPKK